MHSEMPPLVVDLDKTLVRTDTLVEAILLLIKARLLYLFALPFWLLSGKSRFKSEINARISIPVELLNYNQELIQYLKDQKQKGRRIVLATASHIDVAKRVAEHLQLFDQVLASDDKRNLKGKTKLAEIQKTLGPAFSYAGDANADIPIWNAATSVILVDTSAKIEQRYRHDNKLELSIRHPSTSLKEWIKAFRVHQWVKNALVFVPLIMLFAFETSMILNTCLAALAFSLLASATYLFNDLFDLFSDRAHRTKQYRPLPAGRISIEQAIMAMLGMGFLSLIIALQVNTLFLLILLTYLVMTVSYSLILKRYVLLDTIMLSLLYTIRIVAGSAAIGTATSEWLLAFSVFMFLSLALVKRCSELVVLKASEKESSRGRDYRVSDLAVLWPLGVGSAITSVAIFCQYISNPAIQVRYSSPGLLWLAAPALIYWLSRLWIKTSRGEMHDDPIVYAFSNKGSLYTIMFVLLVVILAHLLDPQILGV
ncbi:MAG: UbiA family prenyltransferase [Oleiphilus sp.]|nr:MAG: UbiA family prenyltransferase [Oleiphilus sp.]